MLRQALFRIVHLNFSHHSATMADPRKSLVEDLEAQYDVEERSAAKMLKGIREKKECVMKA
jgi:hypothetical protein